MSGPNDSPVTELKGVGPQLAEKLARLGIHSVVDVLFHLPLRYQNRTRVSPIGSLQAGREALVRGQIELSGTRFGRRRSLVTIISDDTGQLTMRQFHFSTNQQRGLQRGNWIQCYGEVRAGPAGLEMVHPEYRLLSAPTAGQTEDALTPVYPSTEGLGQRKWRDLTSQALVMCGQGIPELLPDTFAAPRPGISLAAALALLHRPPPETDMVALQAGKHPAQARLVFEELLAHHLAVRQRRQQREALTAPQTPPSTRLWPQLRT
ncbi:MAG: OB-fold nucleic acid binding domain-containing protein, partial [Arenicellales bacterium]|nr:OB-fold nucleic acid binding domain-containing protein [Arenicellales bacterium]